MDENELNDKSNRDYYEGIWVFFGSGKAWLMQYVSLYEISCELYVTTTAMMAKRSVQLGGKHWYQIFCLPTEKSLSPYIAADRVIEK